VLSSICPVHDPNLLVGFETSDDAAVYRMSEDTAVLLTVDFFTPIVDDPYDFGAIAAANALSDLYAMGAKPLTALNLIAFPKEGPLDVLGEIMRGGAEKASEAGVSIIGGHSIDDREPKYGMAVTGVVHPQKMMLKAGVKAGDRLVLTKPLGIGIISTAIKAGRASDETIRAAVKQMKTLNRAASEAMIDAGCNMGLSRDDAAQLAVQTAVGTAKLLDGGMSPERLRQMVTSPGGTTAAGLKVFEEKGLKNIVSDALHAAQNRAQELGKKA